MNTNDTDTTAADPADDTASTATDTPATAPETDPYPNSGRVATLACAGIYVATVATVYGLAKLIRK